MNQVRNHEGPYAGKYGFHGDVAWGGEDKDIQAERWSYKPDLNTFDDDHTEPYGVKSGNLDHGKDKGEGENHGSEDIPECPDDYIENNDAEDNNPPRYLKP